MYALTFVRIEPKSESLLKLVILQVMNTVLRSFRFFFNRKLRNQAGVNNFKEILKCHTTMVHKFDLSLACNQCVEMYFISTEIILLDRVFRVVSILFK